MTLEYKLAQPWERLFTFARNLDVNSSIGDGVKLPSIYIETREREGFAVFSEEVNESFWLNITPVDLAMVQERQLKSKHEYHEITDFLLQGVDLRETMRAIQSATLVAEMPGCYCKGLWLCGSNDVDIIIRPNYSLPGSLDLRLLI